jgi:hypothetical protein
MSALISNMKMACHSLGVTGSTGYPAHHGPLEIAACASSCSPLNTLQKKKKRKNLAYL